MTITATLSDTQRAEGERVDALDLEPIAFKLMHPEPGETGMTLAVADQLIAAYRCFLKLAAWYPEESIVPSKAIDQVWHAHILDTAKYAEDSEAVFGYFMHHFPYLGLRGEDDEVALHAAYEHTRELFRQHFGVEPGRQAGKCDIDGTGDEQGNACWNIPGSALANTCNNDGQDGTGCVDASAVCSSWPTDRLLTRWRT